MTACSSNGTDAPREAMCPHRWQHSDPSPLIGTPRRGGGSAAQEAPSQTCSAPGVDVCSHPGITVPRPDGQYLGTEPLGSLQGLKGVTSRALSTNNPPYVGPKARNYAEGHAVKPGTIRSGLQAVYVFDPAGSASLRPPSARLGRGQGGQFPVLVLLSVENGH